MASPQMPIDPRYYRRYRQRSMSGPIVLVAVGVMLLLMNMHVLSWGRVGWLFATWWPVLLIILGVVRMAEYAMARSAGDPAPRFGGGTVFLLILVVVAGLSASSARRVNWQAFGDNVDVNPGISGFVPVDQAGSSASGSAQPYTADPGLLQRSCGPGGMPIGAIILIALGVLLLLDNLGVLSFRWTAQFWPVVLIVLGIWLAFRRMATVQGRNN